MNTLGFALPEKLRVRLVIVVVHRLPFFALRLHLFPTRRPLTARVIATLTLAACESVAFSVVPFLAEKRLEPSLTADSVGELGRGRRRRRYVRLCHPRGTCRGDRVVGPVTTVAGEPPVLPGARGRKPAQRVIRAVARHGGGTHRRPA